MNKPKEWVQCFYNVNYKEGHYSGQSRAHYGFGYFHLCGDCEPLKGQILKAMGMSEDKVFNFNLTSFTPFPSQVFEDKPDEVDYSE